MSTSTWRKSRVPAAVVAVLGLSLAAAAPAFADTGTWLNGGSTGATVSVADAVIQGDSIHLEGTGWTDGADDGDADGSWIAVKLGAAGGVEGANLTTEPSSGQFVFPGQTSGTASIWSGIVADDDGDFSADIPFPTTANTANPALTSEWAAGTTHHLQLLTGSVKPGGDTVRSVYVTFTVSADTLTVTTSVGTRGASAGQLTVTVAGAAGTFADGEVLTAAVDGTDAAWATGGTASDTGALTGTTVVFASGALTAGEHTIAVTGATSGTKTRTFTVLPTPSYSSLTQGSSGTLTLSNLPAGSSVTAASFDGTGVVFSGLPTAAVDGVATLSYTIPADQALGTYPVTVTLDEPAATFTLSSQKISPDATIFGDDAFTLSSYSDGIFQGLYQSAYSEAQDALFATAASGTGSAEDGYLYKLDPDTLEIVASVHPKDVADGDDVVGQAPYGVGVDDVNGTVWVTNTRTGAVAVYDADDLTLLKQYAAGTISHPRDVIYDPGTNRVFASSASEGTSGDGYISVFDAATFEKITDIQTGARADFNPVSLDVEDGVLVSPSLSSNQVAKIDTDTLEVTFLTITGIDVGGRGASGIDYDADDNRLYIASQNTDELVIADATTGETLAEVPTGTGALNVAVDEVNSLVYVTNLSGGTVTVTDLDGTKVANLPIVRANHVTVDGQGNAYVVDKNTVNSVWKITPDEIPTDDGTDDGADDGTDTTAGSIDTVPTEDQLTASTEGLISGPASAAQGEQITVTIETEHGTTVHAWIFSTATDLGIVTGLTGDSFSVTIPADLATGVHSLAVTDDTGTVIGWYSLTVTAAAAASSGSLAVTGGSDAGWMPAAGALLLLLGGAAFVVARRRSVRGS
ncbi:MAG: LPXTG cell wall anchor domain-containing protein [Microbacterium sp.]|uniref:LPXTG cell wall anchor domain-containing protein n=1 Tax=Microbacterium sp. TaxID=51671 RepID=UPI0039E23E3E